MTAVRERRFHTATEKLMMMVLCDYINGDDEAWPGNGTLAEDTGVDEKTIKRSLARLEAAGVIARRRRPATNRGRATDAIQFLWAGFRGLPLVRGDQGDTMPPTDQGDIQSDQGDIGTPDQGDNRALPTVYRTPQIEPPKEPARTPARPAAFEAFYTVYPRHEAPGAALKAWSKAVAAAGGDAQRIIDGALRYRNDPNRDPAFTAYPATWLNGQRWDDDPLPPRNGNGGRPTSKVDQRAAEALERLRQRQQGAG